MAHSEYYKPLALLTSLCQLLPPDFYLFILWGFFCLCDLLKMKIQSLFLNSIVKFLTIFHFLFCLFAPLFCFFEVVSCCIAFAGLVLDM